MTGGTTGPPPTSEEEPWPVRTVARKIADWISRLGTVWVEGQVTQLSVRPGTQTAFITLRDPAADVSVTVTCPSTLIRNQPTPLTDGMRIVVHARPTFFLNRGTLSLRADEIRAVGIGELLARIERLRRLLAAEGMFDPARKRRPPFLPRTVGLITGRASAAERDVLANARARWPAVRFRVENVATQGGLAVQQMIEALSALDRDAEVDVIVIARGGGSVEDLLPFSDEALCRAVSSCRTPVVSAIGHEPDSPLLDHVADVRCSTPTDAGKRVVPDVGEEARRVTQLRDRARRALHGWVDRERRLLDSLRSRPVLADPLRPLDRHAEAVRLLVERARRAVLTDLSGRHTALHSTKARLTTLGPAATLTRGYAVVQLLDLGDHDGDGSHGDAPSVLRSVDQVTDGTRLRVRLVDGALHAVVSGDPERAAPVSGGSGGEAGV
ncbi:exodeoxyribonuclease VII large subunit [Herbihabitans rhizosphaerae]|uniref:Exodeoxyribonuclease 7 large subunit n=1 Tax=Herbihabitans rhizosphaerae TaxID=1872711 RepID=A0A4Q7L6A9_9PSEU|nr:exodeoxyribonuclease VII large subunit [Herbihabitans rhizosphaerae]RZS44390.1 exodeoxyribonuclease VII large subunit [Herbihabitans rhizosphaerae]